MVHGTERRGLGLQMFDDLIVELDPPPIRQGKCTGGKERHLTEAAVMLAYGMHLLQTVPALTNSQTSSRW